MDKLADRQTGEWIHGQVGGWTVRRMGVKDVWMDRWVAAGWGLKQTDGRVDEWTDGQEGGQLFAWLDQ